MLNANLPSLFGPAAGFARFGRDDIEILGAAASLIHRHGGNAVGIAGMRADEMAERGDTRQQVRWLRIRDAVRGLLREPGDGESIH